MLCRPTLLEATPTPGRSIEWDAMERAQLPLFGRTRRADVAPKPLLEGEAPERRAEGGRDTAAAAAADADAAPTWRFAGQRPDFHFGRSRREAGRRLGEGAPPPAFRFGGARVAAAAAALVFTPSAEALRLLTEMGFPREQCLYALRLFANHAEAAAEVRPRA